MHNDSCIVYVDYRTKTTSTGLCRPHEEIAKVLDAHDNNAKNALFVFRPNSAVRVKEWKHERT